MHTHRKETNMLGPIRTRDAERMAAYLSGLPNDKSRNTVLVNLTDYYADEHRLTFAEQSAFNAYVDALVGYPELM